MEGKLTLINGVVDGMPTYLMSLFSMPAAVEKNINSMRNLFLWECNAGKKEDALNQMSSGAEWQKSGAYEWNLKINNKSLLFKWFWRCMLEQDEVNKGGWRPSLHMSAKGGI